MSVEARNIQKAFAGVRVLDDVNLLAGDGDVHALLGANGSGKSTLVKILSGVYQPEAGSIRIGRDVRGAILTPFDANELGIAVVHQEAPLIDTMSVAECIALIRGYPSTPAGRVRWRAVEENASALLRKFDIRVSPRALAGKLAPADRALVALAIALDRVDAGVQLLILDEVTASLPEDDAKVYLERVREIARSGVAVLMVTHRLAELAGLATTVTVLRDGKLVYSAPFGEVDDAALVAHMVGVKPGATAKASARTTGIVRRLWDSSAIPARPGGEGPALDVRGLSGDLLEDVSFTVERGEIVGIAGLADSGLAELPELLAGVRRPRGGEIRVNGRPFDTASGPSGAIDAGLALLPADRLRNGGVATLTLAENALLPLADRFWRQRRREIAVLDRIVSDFDVRPPRPRTLFGKLSGGNQQKVILAKWLLTRPSVLILDDPTSGVDPGARETIFERLHDVASEGVGIVLFSTEPEQLAAMCGRILVIRRGSIVTELTGRDLNRETISQWCYA